MPVARIVLIKVYNRNINQVNLRVGSRQEEGGRHDIIPLVPCDIPVP